MGGAVRVLGIDPGLTRCGIGIVEGNVGRRPSLVDLGVIRTSSQQAHEYRLLTIERGIEEWVTKVHPDAIAVERVFAQHNLATVTGTSQAAGIAMLIAARHAVPVTLHTPSEVKAAITGSGRADKAQVGELVRRVLDLDEVPKPADTADALALAICHLWRGTATNRLSAAMDQHRTTATTSLAHTRWAAALARSKESRT